MVVLAAVLSVVLGVWVTFVQPFVGRRRYRRLIERLEHDPSARLHHYRRGITFEWLGAAFVGLLALLAHSRVRSLWPPGDNTAVAGQIPGIAVALVLVTAVYRLGGRRMFALLALTAGICEELLYRGFGLAALRWAAPGIGNAALIVVTAAAFGLAHLYQGRMGVALTGLVGAYFAWIAISTGSLVPVMVLHALLDLRILGLPLDAVPFPVPDP